MLFRSGYSGRLGIYELLLASHAIQQLVVQRVSAAVIKEQALQEGLATLRSSGWQRVLSGVTTVEEVMRVTKDDELGSKPAAAPKAPGEDPVILAIPGGA